MTHVITGVLLLIEIYRQRILLVVGLNVSGSVMLVLSGQSEFVFNGAKEAGDVLGLHFVRSEVVGTGVEQLVGFQCELAAKFLSGVERLLLYGRVLQLEDVVGTLV